MTNYLSPILPRPPVATPTETAVLKRHALFLSREVATRMIFAALHARSVANLAYVLLLAVTAAVVGLALVNWIR